MMLAWEIATVAWARSQHPRVQLQAHQEHVQDHAKLGDDAEERRDRRREDDGGGLGPDSAQQGGAQEDPPTTSPITGGCPVPRKSGLSSRPMSRTAVRATRTWTRASGLPPTAAEPLAPGAAGPGATSRPPRESMARNSTTAPTTIAPYINAMRKGDSPTRSANRSSGGCFMGWARPGARTRPSGSCRGEGPRSPNGTEGTRVGRVPALRSSGRRGSSGCTPDPLVRVPDARTSITRPSHVAEWIVEHEIRVLNVAGNRESKCRASAIASSGPWPASSAGWGTGRFEPPCPAPPCKNGPPEHRGGRTAYGIGRVGAGIIYQAVTSCRSSPVSRALDPR